MQEKLVFMNNTDWLFNYWWSFTGLC